MDDLQNILREKGLKVTAPRLQILALLHNKECRHSSAERLQKSLVSNGSRLALATIYRVLAQFEEAGLVIKHLFTEKNAVFELCDSEHHDHMVCVNCGDILEFCDDIIEKRQEILAKKYHFKMLNHDMAIYGMCCKCAN